MTELDMGHAMDLAKFVDPTVQWSLDVKRLATALANTRADRHRLDSHDQAKFIAAEYDRLAETEQ